MRHSRNLKMLSVLVVVFTFILGVSNTSLASAIDLTQNVVYQGSGSNPQWRDDSTSSVSNTWHTGRIVYGGNSGNAAEFSSFYVRANSGSNLPIQNSWFLQVSGRISFNGTDNKWNTSGNFIYTSTGNCPIIDMDTVEVQSHAGSTANTTQIYNYTITCKYTGSDNGVPQIGFKVQSTSQLDTYQFSVQNWFLWQYRSNSYDDTNVINAINNVRSSINNVYNAIGSTNNKLDDTNDKLDDLNEIAATLRDSQEQANQDANDRYEDEKDTINDNATNAQNQANNAQFGFNVGNPLTTWLGLFTGNNCVDIPTIASWIHSNETTVCSPWASSIRDVTTPIISVLSGTILFGFIVKWLNGSSFNESIEVG